MNLSKLVLTASLGAVIALSSLAVTPATGSSQAKEQYFPVLVYTYRRLSLQTALPGPTVMLIT
jgi:hypothetical protein